MNLENSFVALFSIVINVRLLFRVVRLFRMAFAEYCLQKFIWVVLSVLLVKTYLFMYFKFFNMAGCFKRRCFILCLFSAWHVLWQVKTIPELYNCYSYFYYLSYTQKLWSHNRILHWALCYRVTILKQAHLLL